MKRYFLIALFSIFLCPFSIYALDSSENINVYMFPHELTSDDKLQDGPSGEPFNLADNTLLIWVDQHPEAKFAHSTIYILISSDGTLVEHGMWWPVLNGKQILYGSRNKQVMISPFEVSSGAFADPPSALPGSAYIISVSAVTTAKILVKSVDSIA